MTTTAVDRSAAFLSTLPAGRNDRRLAFWVLVASVVFFVAAVPFAKTPLAPVPAFIPVYQSALVVNDLITAALLFGQFRILARRALLILAIGYLFTGLMAAAHTLSFPGLFAPTGLLGAGPQSTAWLYMFWHGFFPLCVIGYTVLRDEELSETARAPALIAGGIVIALVVAAGFVVTATSMHDALPAIMSGNRYTPVMIVVVSGVWGLSLLALGFLWSRKPHSVLDLWLMVVLCAWLFDIALAAVLNAGRFDLGFYAGRIYGLLAASFVLILLLLENSALHARERIQAAEARRLGAELADANQALAAQNRQLEQADRLKSEFLANMSHELRTPLNAIIGFSEVIRNGLAGPVTERQRDFANDIHMSGMHLLSLINDVLDLSKIEAGSMQLDRESVNLRALLESGLAVVREKALARRIELRSELDPALGSLDADSRKIKQIVYNLLSNAVKFSDEGGRVVLRATRVDRARVDSAAHSFGRVVPPAAMDAEFVEISVDDSGIGIAEADLARLFEPFVQVDASRTRRHEGTGLGLALVHRLVDLHEGGLAVSSTPGRGSRFAVWLPCRDAAAPPVQPAAHAPVKRAAPLALVIEDDDAAARLLTRELEAQGVAVIRASTAEEGLVVARKHRPDLITLDLFLPHIDGWECLDRLRKDAITADIPVVIVTVSSETRRGLALGSVRVLQKPVVRENLVTLLQQLDIRGAPATVLVADDDANSVELVASHLQSAGISVLRAYGGLEAIDVALAERPTLLILDIVMPGVSGFDVVAALKANPHGRTIPIVILTSKSLSADERAELNGQVTRVVDKSRFSDEDFLSEVRRALAAAPLAVRPRTGTAS